jgi:hypothetical protein
MRSQSLVKKEKLSWEVAYFVTGPDPCTAEVRESVNFEA